MAELLTIVADAVRKSGHVTNSDKWEVAQDVIDALTERNLLAVPVLPDASHCATCTCAPGMTPSMRYDLSPAMREGKIREHLIALGWTPPGEARQLEYAIGHAAASLPEGYDVEISVERGSASVYLYHQGRKPIEPNDDTLAEQVRRAVDEAKREAAHG